MIPVGNLDLHKGINSSAWIQISFAGVPVSTQSEVADVEMERRQPDRDRYTDQSEGEQLRALLSGKNTGKRILEEEGKEGRKKKKIEILTG